MDDVFGQMKGGAHELGGLAGWLGWLAGRAAGWPLAALVFSCVFWSVLSQLICKLLAGLVAAIFVVILRGFYALN